MFSSAVECAFIYNSDKTGKTSEINSNTFNHQFVEDNPKYYNIQGLKFKPIQTIQMKKHCITYVLCYLCRTFDDWLSREIGFRLNSWTVTSNTASFFVEQM